MKNIIMFTSIVLISSCSTFQNRKVASNESAHFNHLRSISTNRQCGDLDSSKIYEGSQENLKYICKDKKDDESYFCFGHGKDNKGHWLEKIDYLFTRKARVYIKGKVLDNKRVFSFSESGEFRGGGHISFSKTKWTTKFTFNKKSMTFRLKEKSKQIGLNPLNNLKPYDVKNTDFQCYEID